MTNMTTSNSAEYCIGFSTTGRPSSDSWSSSSTVRPHVSGELQQDIVTHTIIGRRHLNGGSMGEVTRFRVSLYASGGRIRSIARTSKPSSLVPGDCPPHSIFELDIDGFTVDVVDM